MGMKEILGSGTVAWSDTDASGMIHFTAVLRWVEVVEHRFYRTEIPDLDLRHLPRRALAVTYHRPFVSGDSYEVELAPEHVGTSSYRFRWRVLRGENVHIDGHHTVVYVGDNGKAARLPADLRRILEDHLVD